MGEIQQLSPSQDYVMLQEPREYYLRAPSWSTWTEVRMGMFWTMIPTGNYQTYCLAETITTASYLDWLCWGLKDPSSNIPGVAGSQFVGLAWGTTVGNTVTLSSNLSSYSTIGCTTPVYGAINGTSILSTATSFVSLYTATYSLAAWANFLGLKLVVNNAGASNQSITCTMYSNTNGNTADMSVNNLRTQIFNVAYAISGTINWNSGGVALPLPTYWYLRLPFNLSRIKITAMEMFKIS